MMTYNNNTAQDREFGFDDVITQDTQEFITLKPGEYEFEVREIEKTRYNGSSKPDGLPPCNQVKVFLDVFTPEGKASVIDNIYLHSRVEWRISSFFAAIGMKKKGEPLRMNWNEVVGKHGKAKFTVNEYNGREYNNVSNYILPDDYESSGASKNWTAGAF
jgi:hypothetical protein